MTEEGKQVFAKTCRILVGLLYNSIEFIKLSQKDKFLCQKKWKLDVALETIIQMWNQEDMDIVLGKNSDKNTDPAKEDNDNKNESKDATKGESDKDQENEDTKSENKRNELTLKHRKILLQSHLQYQISNILSIPLPMPPAKTYGADFIVLKSKILVKKLIIHIGFTTSVQYA